mmetsp:Transcript_20744/g.58352  ORF Transcript_20744/g.58352 Transcript_20744/m.58352 type:complete len:221 (+) Transcript_20744:595-1257(+)
MRKALLQQLLRSPAMQACSGICGVRPMSELSCTRRVSWNPTGLKIISSRQRRCGATLAAKAPLGKSLRWHPRTKGGAFPRTRPSRPRRCGAACRARRTAAMAQRPPSQPAPSQRLVRPAAPKSAWRGSSRAPRRRSAWAHSSLRSWRWSPRTASEQWRHCAGCSRGSAQCLPAAAGPGQGRDRPRRARCSTHGAEGHGPLILPWMPGVVHEAQLGREHAC